MTSARAAAELLEELAARCDDVNAGNADAEGALAAVEDRLLDAAKAVRSLIPSAAANAPAARVAADLVADGTPKARAAWHISAAELLLDAATDSGFGPDVDSFALRAAAHAAVAQALLALPVRRGSGPPPPPRDPDWSSYG